MRRLTRIIHIVLIGMLVFGLPTVFAAPMPMAHGGSGETTSIGTEPVAGCSSCPRHDDGMAAGHCDAACPLLAALAASVPIVENPGKPAWTMGTAVVRLGLVRPVDPGPPKFSLPLSG